MLNVGLLSKLGDTKVVPTPCMVVFTLVHPAGESFMYYETLETPGITNYTHVTRTTTIESVSDSTSTFSQ